jgi:hypothetical protein
MGGHGVLLYYSDDRTEGYLGGQQACMDEDAAQNRWTPLFPTIAPVAVPDLWSHQSTGRDGGGGNDKFPSAR